MSLLDTRSTFSTKEQRFFYCPYKNGLSLNPYVNTDDGFASLISFFKGLEIDGPEGIAVAMKVPSLKVIGGNIV